MTLQHLSGSTYHRRRGETKNTFKYDVDYVLVDLNDKRTGPAFFSRNRGNLMSIFDRDYGGERGSGAGIGWVKTQLKDRGIEIAPNWKILLMAQPRMLGTRFSPVSFWLILDGDDKLRAAIAEVNNTFGERHSYFCSLPNVDTISSSDVIPADKIFHVSPFQPMDGEYRFNFDVTSRAIKVRIDYRHNEGGVLATLETFRNPLTNLSTIKAVARRPLGSIRVLALIHFQALKLWMGGAPFRTKPEPPESETS